MIEFNRYYLQLFRKLFGPIEEESLRLIFDTGKKVDVQIGEYLFHQGDKENTLFIVLSGRFRALIEEGGNTHILGDIGEGEPIGEFALFTNKPRIASVLAIRKSIVLEIHEKEYLELVSKNPIFATALTKFVIERLQRNTFELNKSSPPKNITIINLQKENSLSPWTDDMEKYFQDQKIPINVYFQETAESLTNEGIFEKLEQNDGMNILVCDDNHADWSRQCLIYADLVVVATEFYADPKLYQIEKDLELYAKNILNKKIFLLLLHPENGHQPKNTAAWLKPRKVNLHIHIRQNNGYDIRRFCRIISNKAVGLVLGGGGSKGYAHLGVTKALIEAGIEIDFLGGTSAGAIYGIVMSHADFDFKKVEKTAIDSVKRNMLSRDLALPMVSFMTGKKVKKFFRDSFKDDHLEDIWINSYCVSTNFSSALTIVHKEGLIWKKILASVSIPGIFPPVVIDRELHVDGAVVDNLPIEPMYEYPVGNIIAVALSGFPSRKVNYQETPSSWSIFWNKIFSKKKFKIPGLASIIINSLTINSRQKQESTKSKVSLYFELDLQGVGFLDNKKWKNIQNKGFKQTNEYLESLEEKEKFWLN
jgi:predicted acylesterase/phospholipase RssA/CRP-like cAMP-binding protein